MQIIKHTPDKARRLSEVLTWKRLTLGRTPQHTKRPCLTKTKIPKLIMPPWDGRFWPWSWHDHIHWGRQVFSLIDELDHSPVHFFSPESFQVTAHKPPEVAICGCNLRIEKDVDSIRFDQNYINTQEDAILLLYALHIIRLHSIWDNSWIKQLHNHRSKLIRKKFN